MTEPYLVDMSLDFIVEELRRGGTGATATIRLIDGNPEVTITVGRKSEV